MTDVLILGGTGWVSGRVARAWLDAGEPAVASEHFISSQRDDRRRIDPRQLADQPVAPEPRLIRGHVTRNGRRWCGGTTR